MSTNPFQPTSDLQNEKGVFSDFATLRRAGFLYRAIDFQRPFVARFIYTGWWFRQAIYLDDSLVWFRISWSKIHTELAFRVPATLDQRESVGQVEINFSRGLMIRRFRIWIDAKIIYDEIH